MGDIIQITKFPERIRIRIQFKIGDATIYIKPDSYGTEEKFPGIMFDYGILFRVKRLGDRIINIKLTESGEHILTNIADKHMHIGEMVYATVDNDTGDVLFKSESSDDMNLGATVRDQIIVNDKLRKELSLESV